MKNQGRQRYIGFVIKSSSEDFFTKRDQMNKVLREQCSSVFKKNLKELGIRLIKFNGVHGIIRCNHIEKDNAITLLKSINSISSKKVEVDTLGTSGTIKSLMKKHMSDLPQPLI